MFESCLFCSWESGDGTLFCCGLHVSLRRENSCLSRVCFVAGSLAMGRNFAVACMYHLEERINF